MLFSEMVHKGGINGMNCSGDGRYLVTQGSSDNLVKVLTLSDATHMHLRFELVQTFTHPDFVSKPYAPQIIVGTPAIPVFSVDQRYILAMSMNGIYCWDAATGGLESKFVLEDTEQVPNALNWTLPMALSIHKAGRLRMWDST